MTEPAFVTRPEPHVTMDLLRQGYAALPQALRRYTDPLLQRAKESGAAAAAEGAVRALTPEQPWEVPLAFLPVAKLRKPALAASATLASMEDAEASAIARRMAQLVADTLREYGGAGAKFNRALDAAAKDMPATERAQLSRARQAANSADWRRRELLTNPEEPVVFTSDLPKPSSLRFEDLFKPGDVLVPVAGDTTRTATDIHRAGVDLPEPVRMHGGHDYGLQGGAPWASELSAAAGKQANFAAAQDLSKTGNVYGLHLAMTPEGAHYARHTSDLWLGQLQGQGGVSPKVARAFNDDVVQRLYGVAGPKGRESAQRAESLWREVGGIGKRGEGSPELRQALATAALLRKGLMAAASKPGAVNAGLPDIARTYEAALDPTVTPGKVGAAVMRADPDGLLLPSAHPTYGYDLPGEYIGRLDFEADPLEIWGPSLSHVTGNPIRSLQVAHHARLVDQQLIDQMAKARERALAGAP